MVHINNPDNIVKSMISVSGTITINAEKEPAIQISADTNRIDIDILRPELFKLFKPIEDDDETDQKREGRMDKSFLSLSLNYFSPYYEQPCSARGDTIPISIGFLTNLRGDILSYPD